MAGFNPKVWASAPTTFGWIGNSGEPPQKRFQLGNIVPGTPVLAKHSKSFSLIDCISVGVDRMQRNFEPMRKQVETWQRSELTDVTAKVEVRGIPAENDLESLQCVHVSIQGTGSHSTVRATAKLGEFLEAQFSQSF
jgi:hypothetical protein